MTLDCTSFRLQQPRVISVHSYYLTSLVNLSFCGLDVTFSVVEIPSRSQRLMLSFYFVLFCLVWFGFNVQTTSFSVQNDIIFFKVRISSRNILEGPSRLMFGNDVMFKGVASGQLSCIHLNVHLIIKCFFQYFSPANSKRNIRVMNQLNLICAFVLVVIKHLSSV